MKQTLNFKIYIMRKLFFILICVFIVGSTQVNAQSLDEQKDIRELTLRVDSLENELRYYRALYDITSLCNDITQSNNDVRINTLEIKSDIISNSFEKQFWEYYRNNYDICETKLKMYLRRIEGMRLYVGLLDNLYSEDKMSYLSNNFKLAEIIYGQLETSLKIYESAIDIYRKGL